MVHIKSTLHALYNKDFQCGYCLNKYNSRPDKDAMIERTKKTKGCETPFAVYVHKIVQPEFKISYKDCIGNYFSNAVVHWVIMHDHFERGVMPFNGGYFDQPNKAIEVLSTIGSQKRRQRDLIDAARKAKVKSQIGHMRGR